MADEDEQFTLVFNDLYPSLCRFLGCLLGDRAAAQDVAQDSFLRMHRFGLYRLPHGEARFWLFRVARNLALNELDRARTRTRLADAAAGAFRISPSTPEDDLFRAERSQWHAKVDHFGRQARARGRGDHDRSRTG